MSHSAASTERPSLSVQYDLSCYWCYFANEAFFIWPDINLIRLLNNVRPNIWSQVFRLTPALLLIKLFLFLFSMKGFYAAVGKPVAFWGLESPVSISAVMLWGYALFVKLSVLKGSKLKSRMLNVGLSLEENLNSFLTLTKHSEAVEKMAALKTASGTGAGVQFASPSTCDKLLRCCCCCCCWTVFLQKPVCSAAVSEGEI